MNNLRKNHTQAELDEIKIQKTILQETYLRQLKYLES